MLQLSFLSQRCRVPLVGIILYIRGCTEDVELDRGDSDRRGGETKLVLAFEHFCSLDSLFIWISECSSSGIISYESMVRSGVQSRQEMSRWNGSKMSNLNETAEHQLWEERPSLRDGVNARFPVYVQVAD